MEKDNSIKLLRELMGSVDLSDIDKIEKELLTEEEYRNRATQSEAFYRQHLEKALKLFIQEQLEWIGTKTQGVDQLMFGRGTINGLMLVKGWFDTQMVSLAQEKEDSKNLPGINP